jgi:hypothetical protein
MYHIYCRCVRRAFLLGKDPLTGEDKSHRRTWVKERIEHLAAYFAIDIFFVGFLSNHFHIVLRNLPEQVEGWSDEQVIRRSCKIFPYKFKRLGVADGEPTEERMKELLRDKNLITQLRKRLADPSWFVRQLNQKIALLANSEDETSGHFFDGRFGGEPISNLFALVICGLYVDLNEYAAGLSTSVDTSHGSSVYFRTQGRQRRKVGDLTAYKEDGFLCPVFVREEPQGYPPAGQEGGLRASDKGVFDFTLNQYVESLQMLMSRLDEARRELAAGEKLPIDKDLVASLLRDQHAFVAIASDFGK